MEDDKKTIAVVVIFIILGLLFVAGPLRKFAVVGEISTLPGWSASLDRDFATKDDPALQLQLSGSEAQNNWFALLIDGKYYDWNPSLGMGSEIPLRQGYNGGYACGAAERGTRPCEEAGGRFPSETSEATYAVSLGGDGASVFDPNMRSVPNNWKPSWQIGGTTPHVLGWWWGYSTPACLDSSSYDNPDPRFMSGRYYQENNPGTLKRDPVLEGKYLNYNSGDTILLPTNIEGEHVYEIIALKATPQISTGDWGNNYLCNIVKTIPESDIETIRRLPIRSAGVLSWRGKEIVTTTEVAIGKYTINPKPCFLNPDTQIMYSLVFGPGATVTKEKLTGFQQFCSTFPANSLRSDTGEQKQEYGIMHDIDNGGSYKVPPGFLIEFRYIANKKDVGIGEIKCEESKIYSGEQKRCVVTGLFFAFKDFEGTAQISTNETLLVLPGGVCAGDAQYNASVSEDKCNIPRCPAGSEWEKTITSCGRRLRYSKDICKAVDGTYDANTDECIVPKSSRENPDGTLSYFCPAGTNSISRTGTFQRYNSGATQAVWEASGKPLSTNFETFETNQCDTTKAFTSEVCTFDNVEYSEILSCTAPPQFNCDAVYSGTRFVRDEFQTYFCAYGPESLKPCPAGTITEPGYCLAKETLNITKIVFQDVEREVEVIKTVVVEKKVPVEKEVIVYKEVSREKIVIREVTKIATRPVIIFGAAGLGLLAVYYLRKIGKL